VRGAVYKKLYDIGTTENHITKGMEDTRDGSVEAENNILGDNPSMNTLAGSSS
jgi:hypothetical protein